MNRAAALLRPIDWNARWFVAYLHRLRRFELSEIVKSMPGATRIVEIGGGTGYQAHLLNEQGYSVVSVDIPGSCHSPSMFANVMQYDGRRLPFANNSFDAALSSIVMPWVADSRALQQELARILRPGGFCVHVLPTHFWGIWRLVFYHLFLLKSAVARLMRREGAPAPRPPQTFDPTARRATAEVLRRCLVPQPVAVRGNAFTEPWFFRPAWWREHFVRNGWAVIEERPITFYHTGYRLLGSLLSVSARRRLARLLGPSSHLFKVAPKANAYAEGRVLSSRERRWSSEP